MPNLVRTDVPGTVFIEPAKVNQSIQQVLKPGVTQTANESQVIPVNETLKRESIPLAIDADIHLERYR